MPVCIEVTCRDVDVSMRTRQLVLAEAQFVHDFDDLIQVCHVIIRRRVASQALSRGYAVSIDVIRRDGRAVATCLPDRHIYFETPETAIHEAFRGLRCWLRNMAAARRGVAGKHAGADHSCDLEPIDRPDDLVEPHVAAPALWGSHHFVG